MYGQTHPIESATLIATKLHEFENEIQHAVCDCMPGPKKGTIVEPAFLVAERMCPNITTPSFKLMFFTL